MSSLPKRELYTLVLLKHGVSPAKPGYAMRYQKLSEVLGYACRVFPDWYRHRGQQNHRLSSPLHEAVLEGEPEPISPPLRVVPTYVVNGQRHYVPSRVLHVCVDWCMAMANWYKRETERRNPDFISSDSHTV